MKTNGKGHVKRIGKTVIIRRIVIGLIETLPAPAYLSIEMQFDRVNHKGNACIATKSVVKAVFVVTEGI